jgi:hypothetical protein
MRLWSKAVSRAATVPEKASMLFFYDLRITGV